MEKKKLRITDIIYAAAIAVFCLICYKLFYRMSVNYHGKYSSDFTWYINLPTSQFKERYRLLGWLFDIIYRHTHSITGMVVYLALVIGLIILASCFYLRVYTDRTKPDRLVLQIASLPVLFMGPIYVPVFHEYFYRWSFQTFAWHSPTEQSMILFSIPAFLCFVKMYETSDTGVKLKWWILTMVTGLMSAFAKPAFIIDLIIAMVAMFLIDLFMKSEETFGKKFLKLFIMGCALIPAGLYMLVIMTYSFNGQGDLHEGKVLINPAHILEYNNLFAAVVCGLAFPIVVWAVNYRLLKEKRYRSVFAVFLACVLQWALFVEEGERATHGNFTWGRQAGCFFLFLTAVAIAINNWHDKEFMAESPGKRKLYFVALAVLLTAHIASQLVYFYLICTGHGYSL